MEVTNCSTCKYFLSIRVDNRKDFGVCRRKSPTFKGGTQTKEWDKWPMVHGHDWCGEHS